MKKNKTGLESPQFTVVDLFCGVGGLTHGFIKEKCNVAAGIDFDSTCKYAFEKNNKTVFLHKDITEITAKEILALYPKGHKKVLVGCAPCQPFSRYTHRSKKKKTNDEKWKLLFSFSSLIEKVKPDIVSMENVPMLVNYNKGAVFKDFVGRLEKKGYHVSWSIVNAQDYGVPQRRKRLILLASKEGEISLIKKTVKKKKYVTVRDAIGSLPAIEDGTRHSRDIIHRTRKLTDINKTRIQATKEGGSWRDWDKSLWLKCHKKKSGREFRSVYGRMKWDDVSPTITTFCVGLGNGRFGHPEQDRTLSLREAAILQSFPKSYRFAETSEYNLMTVARHIGNAVPVKLGVAVAKSIKKHLQEIGSKN